LDVFPAFVPLTGRRVGLTGSGEGLAARHRLLSGSPAEIVDLAAADEQDRVVQALEDAVQQGNGGPRRSGFARRATASFPLRPVEARPVHPGDHRHQDGPARQPMGEVRPDRGQHQQDDDG
jgi:hypothetical protein